MKINYRLVLTGEKHLQPCSQRYRNFDKSSAVADKGDLSEQSELNSGGAAVPISVWRELGPHLTQCGLAEAYFCTRWHLEPPSRFATIDTSQKLWGCRDPFGGSWVSI